MNISMKQLFICIIVFLFCVLTACTATKQGQEPVVPEVVEVEIYVPELLVPKEEMELQIKVTQGSDLVEDAEEVEFEVWKHQHRDKGTMVTGVHQGEGIYQVMHSFSDDGVYFVQTHVTAREMHVMPMKQLIVGEVTEEELASLEEEDTSSDASDNGHH